MTPPADDLPPLDDLDPLDAERAADMVYNRPHYGAPAVAAAVVPGAPQADPGHVCPPEAQTVWCVIQPAHVTREERVEALRAQAVKDIAMIEAIDLLDDEDKAILTQEVRELLAKRLRKLLAEEPPSAA